MPPQVWRRCCAGRVATFRTGDGPEKGGAALTKGDLFVAGLTGRPDSAQRRQELLKKLSLPEHMSANALLEVLNTCYTAQEALDLLGLEET